MNTDKLTTIDEEALNGVAGGSVGDIVGGLVDAGVNAGVARFEAGAVATPKERQKIWENYWSDVRKALGV